MNNTAMDRGPNNARGSMTRRDALTVCGLGGLLFGASGMRELSNRLILSKSHISTADAIAHIPADTRRSILLEDGLFAQRMGEALVVLNSIPDKERNQLFLKGQELVNRAEYSFLLNSGSSDPFTVDTDRRQIAISPAWISHAKTANPKLDDVTLTLVTVGGALATLLALEHSEPSIIDTRPIRGQRTKTHGISTAVGGPVAVDPKTHAAALIVGVLVAEQMWQMDAASYFDEWHMLSPVVLEPKELIPSRVEKAIDTNEDLIFEGVPLGQRAVLKARTAEQVRSLMTELHFDQKSIGRRTTS
jgi:hypothetical protein